MAEEQLVTICDEDKDKYRWGYNGKEKINEWAGVGNYLDYGFRGEDTRIGRFLSIDPLTAKFPMLTPYQFASNTPIQAIDMDGLEAFFIHGTISGPNTWSPTFTKFIQLNFTNNTHIDATFSWEDRSNLLNNKRDRGIAAFSLVNHIMEYRKANHITDEEITLIGHSHGGNVAIQAANYLHRLYGIQVNIINFNTPAYNGANDVENPAYNYGIHSLINFWTLQDGVAGGAAGDDKYTDDNLIPLFEGRNIELKNPLKKNSLQSHFIQNVNLEELLQHKGKPSAVPSWERNPESRSATNHKSPKSSSSGDNKSKKKGWKSGQAVYGN